MTRYRTLLSVVVLAVATPALAGELTGNGDPTPVDGYVARSECAFSGLNDDDLPTPDIVQTYGMIVRAFGQPSPGVPGSTCRGNL